MLPYFSIMNVFLGTIAVLVQPLVLGFGRLRSQDEGVTSHG